jgi:hypothetical protein
LERRSRTVHAYAVIGRSTAAVVPAESSITGAGDPPRDCTKPEGEEIAASSRGPTGAGGSAGAAPARARPAPPPRPPPAGRSAVPGFAPGGAGGAAGGGWGQGAMKVVPLAMPTSAPHPLPTSLPLSFEKVHCMFWRAEGWSRGTGAG